MSAQEEQAEVVVSYSLEGGAKTTIRQEVRLQPGMNRIRIPMELPHPVRWMPQWVGQAYSV